MGKTIYYFVFITRVVLDWFTLDGKIKKQYEGRETIYTTPLKSLLYTGAEDSDGSWKGLWGHGGSN